MNWHKSLKGKVSFQESLKKHTTFKIGGRAQFFIEPKDVEDLKLLLGLVKRYKLPVYVIGKGSNILASDKGIKGVILRLSAPYFKRIILTGNRLEVGSGVLLSKLVIFTRDYGLSGLEFLAGIPGTVGGALVMNAGVKDRGMGDLVKKVTVMDYSGSIRVLPKKDIKFGYRESSFCKYIVLSTCLSLARKNKKQVNARIREYLGYRRDTQDLSWPSAGCVFRNPQGDSAGRLIDLCGLKNQRIGGACVSNRHANFILNLGQAKAADVKKLMGSIRKKVKNRFHIALQPEIKIWQ